MFTGLIEQTGKILTAAINGKAGTLEIKPQNPFNNLQFGESIAVNGTCLTLDEVRSDSILKFHVLEETIKRTNLNNLLNGGIVNLERAMRLGDRFGGHIVSGHIDCTARIKAINNVADDFEYEIESPDAIKAYLVEKGSVAIDGISLTIVEVKSDTFTVHLIPVTRADTAIGKRKTGDLVNLEGDILSKFVEKQISMHLNVQTKKSTISMETLLKSGW